MSGLSQEPNFDGLSRIKPGINVYVEVNKVSKKLI